MRDAESKAKGPWAKLTQTKIFRAPGGTLAVPQRENVLGDRQLSRLAALLAVG